MRLNKEQVFWSLFGAWALSVTSAMLLWLYALCTGGDMAWGREATSLLVQTGALVGFTFLHHEKLRGKRLLWVLGWEVIWCAATLWFYLGGRAETVGWLQLVSYLAALGGLIFAKEGGAGVCPGSEGLEPPQVAVYPAGG